MQVAVFIKIYNMQIIGNILLVIAAIAFFSILPAQIGLEKSPGGDYAVGYAWALVFKTALFAISMLLLIIAIGSNGGFATLGANSTNRFLIVTGGLLLIIASIMFVANVRFAGWNIAKPVKMAIGLIPVMLQLLLLVAAFIFLNQKKLASPLLIKGISLALMGVAVAGILISFIGSQVVRQQAIKEFYKDNPQGLDENEQRMMTEIDSCDLSKNMVFLFVFTDANQHKLVREKAVSKIKTNANWQQEIIARLQNDWAPEPFTFLASNKVDSPAIFLEPVRKGILVQAKLVREQIRNCSHPSNIYAGMFSWDLERVLRTVDRFDNMGVDYLPAMKELRSALDAPSRYDKIDFSIAPYFDKWIKKHEK